MMDVSWMFQLDDSKSLPWKKSSPCPSMKKILSSWTIYGPCNMIIMFLHIVTYCDHGNFKIFLMDWTQGSIILPTQTMHYWEGNPWKSPYICSVSGFFQFQHLWINLVADWFSSVKSRDFTTDGNSTRIRPQTICSITWEFTSIAHWKPEN